MYVVLFLFCVYEYIQWEKSYTCRNCCFTTHGVRRLIQNDLFPSCFLKGKPAVHTIYWYGECIFSIKKFVHQYKIYNDKMQPMEMSLKKYRRWISFGADETWWKVFSFLMIKICFFLHMSSRSLPPSLPPPLSSACIKLFCLVGFFLWSLHHS